MNVPLLAGMRVPKVSLQLVGSVEEYRNHAVVEVPFGVMLELSVAVVDVTGDAACVTTVGRATVENVTIVP